MFINETLAMGLTDRFFAEFEQNIDAYRDDFRNVKMDLRKREKWKSTVGAAFTRLNRFSLGVYEGGTPRKPYFVANILEMQKNRRYNTWNERCLSSGQILCGFEPRYTEIYPGNFNISDHTVMRLYMRSQVQEDTRGNLVPNSIIEQCQYLPFWAGFWIPKIIFDGMDMGGRIFPILPAPNGMFLAECPKEGAFIEIRTFVSDFQMTREQKQIRDLFINISDPILQSPMSASPAIDQSGFDTSFFLQAIVSRLLLPEAEKIANLVFQKIEDEGLRSDMKKTFVGNLMVWRNRADVFWDAFHKMPLRKFQTESNHLLRRYTH